VAEACAAMETREFPPSRQDKLVLTFALNLTFSPGEKEQPLHISFLAAGRPANPVADILMKR